MRQTTGKRGGIKSGEQLNFVGWYVLQKKQLDEKGTRDRKGKRKERRRKENSMSDGFCILANRKILTHERRHQKEE